MKKRLILIVLLVFALSLTLVACDGLDNPDEGHQHAFSDKWTYDENSHWHVSTCEHSDEVDGKNNHNFVAVPQDKTIVVCDVCGYSKTDSSHQHILSTEYSADENGHCGQYLCGCVLVNWAPHGFVDGVCVTCGWWKSATDVLFANLSKSDVWNYTVLLDNVYVNAVNLLDDEPQPAELKVSGELQLSLSADGQISGSGYFQTEELSCKAVVSNGMVYAVAEGNYIRCELNDLIAKSGVDIQSYLDQLNSNTQQIRQYFDELKQTATTLPVGGVITDGLLSALIKVDEAKTTDNLTAYVIDNAVLRQLNQMLATVTVQEYVNALLAQFNGTPLGVLLGDDFNGLPDKVYSLLSNAIFITTKQLWAENFTLDDLFKQINGYIAAYYPDENVNTVDELVAALGIDLDDIAKQYGVNLKGVTVQQLVDACFLLSPENLWNLSQKDDSTKINAREINAQLSEICENYGDKTLYQIIALSNEGLTAEYIASFVDGIVDLLDECLTIEFYIDNDGVLQQIDLTLTTTDVTFGQAELEQLKQLLACVNGAITLKRDYELEQDYSQVIEQVEAYYNSLEQTANA